MAVYASDLHRKGELAKVEAMEKLAEKVVRGTGGGLAAVWVTEAFLGADCFAIIEQRPEYEKQSGQVVFDEEKQEPVFIPDYKEDGTPNEEYEEKRS